MCPPRPLRAIFCLVLVRAASTATYYALGLESTNVCVDALELGSAAQCEEAATELGLSYVAPINFSSEPKACFVILGNSVYYNTHPAGAANQMASPICKILQPPSPSENLLPRQASPDSFRITADDTSRLPVG